MTSRRLPEAVETRLEALIRENGFPPGSWAVDEVSTTEIGSSCTVTVKDGDRHLRVFVKYLQVAGDGEFDAAAAAHFANETAFYGEISRRFREISQEGLACIPECLGVGNQPPFVMMKSLEGRASLSVKEALPLDRAHAVLQQLGRFHAHSFALKDRHPRRFAEATSNIREVLFTPQARRFFVHSVHDALKLARRSLPPDSAYVSKLSCFALDAFDALAALAQDDEFAVVTHGDLWPHNIMWNADKNSAAFVDFQGCRLASPVHDLMLFLLTAVDGTVRKNHRDALIRSYHISLCRKLEELGSDPLRLFPRSALDHQLAKHSKFAMTLALVGLPLCFNEDQASLAPPTEEQEEENDELLGFVRRVRRKTSVKCKSKMLEIIMDVIDQGHL